jgi:hypothetical protein
MACSFSARSRFTTFNSSLVRFAAVLVSWCAAHSEQISSVNRLSISASVWVGVSVRGGMFASSDVTGTVAPQIRDMWEG